MKKVMVWIVVLVGAASACCIADEVDKLARALKKIAKMVTVSPDAKPVFDKRTAYDLSSIAGHPVTLYITSGNMLLQKADVVVDAANPLLGPGGYVTGSLQAAFMKYLELSDIKDPWLTIWQKQRIIDKGSVAYLVEGESWLNGPEVVVVTYQDAPFAKLYEDTKGVGGLMRIIHTLAPGDAKVKDVNDPKWRLLYDCIFNSLKEADRGGLKRIAIPLIGSGAFGCDPVVVMHAQVRAVADYLIKNPGSQIAEIHLTSFLGKQDQRYKELISEMDTLIAQEKLGVQKIKWAAIKKGVEEPQSVWV